MPTALSGVTGNLGWGQTKKTETGTGGTTTTPTPTPTPTEPAPTPTEPVTTQTAEPSVTPSPQPASTPSTSQPTEVTSGAPIVTKTYSAPAAANDVSPMPDRLRDLIVDQAKKEGPLSTSLHTLVFRRMDSAPSNPDSLAVDLVERTRAQIIAQASASMIAQANLTDDSVRALLGNAA